ncbi:mitoferrin-2-like [Lineus longissimus]|uniref:mitoferrin-2-like n=1 Tax=Lineus longissimus TaxID=88925 RepID=UPI002B4F4396
MSEDEYESLPGTTTISTHMMAGAFAGVMEHCVMYPVDCVKTRMQCLRPCPEAQYRNMVHALRHIVQQEGIARTMRGVQAVIGGAGPAHALYFACYEELKWMFRGTAQGHHVLANGAAGCVATLIHDAVMNPAEVVKQRLQMYGSPYKGAIDCLKQVFKAEGVRAFYRSYTTQLSMNIPFQSVHFVTYELMQDGMNQGRRYNPVSHMVSGGMAGGVAAAVTTPLDVCKTLLNTQESCVCQTIKVDNMFQAVRAVYVMKGFGGYFRGMQARVIHQIPSAAICWSVYEFFKYFITTHQGSVEDIYINPSPAVQVHAGK